MVIQVPSWVSDYSKDGKTALRAAVFSIWGGSVTPTVQIMYLTLGVGEQTVREYVETRKLHWGNETSSNEQGI